MSRTLIIGGHGRVALLLAPLLVENGHEVVSVVRNPDHVADIEQTGAQAHVADVAELDTAALTDNSESPLLPLELSPTTHDD